MVSGLDVRIVGAEVEVAAGYAIDCQGNEILIAAATRWQLPSDRRPAYLMLAAHERPTDSARIEDGWTLAYRPTDPLRGHRKRKGRWVACGDPHGVPLARLRWARGRWRVAAA